MGGGGYLAQMNKSENSATSQISLQLLLNRKRVGGYMIEVGMSLLKSWKQFFSLMTCLPRSVP